MDNGIGVNDKPGIENEYNNCAQQYEKSKKKSEFQELKTKFESFGTYMHSRDYVHLCEISIKKINKKRNIIVSIVSVGTIIAAILLFTLIIPTIRYNSALSNYDNKDYNEAYNTFKALGNFRDSKFMAEYSKIKGAEVGDTVELGVNKEAYYDQYCEFDPSKNYFEKGEFGWDEIFMDVDEENKKIKWTVLAVEKDKVLLITKDTYSEYQKYDYDSSVHDNYRDLLTNGATWEDSYMRRWLNEVYYKGMFNSKERKIILESQLENKVWPEDKVPSDNNTEDKVFLLSFDEVNKYMPNQQDRIGYNYKGETRRWWLRTPIREPKDEYPTEQMIIHDHGEIVYPLFEEYYSSEWNYEGYASFDDAWCVRPAIWVDTSTR